jgi:putative sigma-54 modulation protein
MQIELVGRRVDLDERLRRDVEGRIGRAQRYLTRPTEARLVVETSAGDKRLFAVDLHVHHAGGPLHARAESPDLRTAVAEVASAIETQAKRDRERRVGGRRRGQRRLAAAKPWPVDIVARDSVRAGKPRIVRSSRLEIKPMTIDEAAERLESSRNEFVVFVDSESERVSVLYKRKDANYGLIAPEL